MADGLTKQAGGGGTTDVSIVVPVYNEDQMIEGVLRMILGVDFGGYSREVVVVNDGSSDRTREILKKFVESKQLRIIHRETNGGKGAAVRDGISAATGRVIIIQDADLEYDPSQIPALAKPILDGATKVVYGSRFRGAIRNMSAIRRLANRFLTGYVNLLFRSRITDACTCYKAIDGEVMRGLGLKSNGFEVCHEITANVLRRGHEIKELPITYCARTVDEGVKSSWKDFVRQLGYILAFRLIRLSSVEGVTS
jgi:glycosyltransferase involved in cell wall biosynthesis